MAARLTGCCFFSPFNARRLLLAFFPHVRRVRLTDGSATPRAYNIKYARAREPSRLSEVFQSFSLKKETKLLDVITVTVTRHRSSPTNLPRYICVETARLCTRGKRFYRVCGYYMPIDRFAW